MTDRQARMPELGARVEALIRGWKAPLRKAAVDYSIAKAAGGNISDVDRDRIAKLLYQAIDREAGGPAVSPDTIKPVHVLGGRTPMAALQDGVLEVTKLIAQSDEKFAISALRIFFLLPRVIKKILPGERFKEDHERALNALKAILAQIPPQSLPSMRVFMAGGLLNRHPRGLMHRTIDRVALVRHNNALFSMIERFFTLVPRNVEKTRGNFDNQLSVYDAGRRAKSVINVLRKRTRTLQAGRREEPIPASTASTPVVPEPITPAPIPPSSIQPAILPTNGAQSYTEEDFKRIADEAGRTSRGE